MSEYPPDRLGMSPEEIYRPMQSRERMRKIITDMTGPSADQIEQMSDAPL